VLCIKLGYYLVPHLSQLLFIQIRMRLYGTFIQFAQFVHLIHPLANNIFHELPLYSCIRVLRLFAFSLYRAFRTPVQILYVQFLPHITFFPVICKVYSHFRGIEILNSSSISCLRFVVSSLVVLGRDLSDNGERLLLSRDVDSSRLLVRLVRAVSTEHSFEYIFCAVFNEYFRGDT